MNQNTFFFKLRSESLWRPLKSETDEWFDIRQRIEKIMHLGDLKNKKTNIELAYIVGFIYTEANASTLDALDFINPDLTLRIDDHAKIEKNSKILIVRLPQAQQVRDRGTYKKYQAPRLHQPQQKKFNPTMTEEEKIRSLIQQSSDFQIDGGNDSNYPPRKKQMVEKMPPHGYICNYCGEDKHYIQFCPHKNDPMFVSLDARRMPPGMLRSDFRLAVTDEEKRTAIISPKGEYLIKKESTSTNSKTFKIKYV